MKNQIQQEKTKNFALSEEKLPAPRQDRPPEIPKKRENWGKPNSVKEKLSIFENTEKKENFWTPGGKNLISI